MINLDEKLRKAIRIASENYPLYSYTLDCLRYEWLDDKKESTMSMSKELVIHCNRQFVNSINDINDRLIGYDPTEDDFYAIGNTEIMDELREMTDEERELLLTK